MSHIVQVGSAALRKEKRTEPEQQGHFIWMFQLLQSLSDSLGHAKVRRGLSYFPPFLSEKDPSNKVHPFNLVRGQ